MSEKMRKVLVSLPIDQKHSPPFGSKFVKQIFSDLTDSFFSLTLIMFALVSPDSIIMVKPIMVDTYDYDYDYNHKWWTHMMEGLLHLAPVDIVREVRAHHLG